MRGEAQVRANGRRRAGGRRRGRCRGPARRRRGSPRRSRGGAAGLSTSGRSASTSVSFVAGTIGQPNPVALGAPLDDVGLQIGDDGLAERHRLEREDAVPAGVQLVDDDVGARVALARDVVGHAFDDVEVDRQLRARLDHVLRALLLAVRRRVHDERARVVARRDGRERAQVEARRDDVRLGHPADRVVGADDLGVGPLAEGELGGRLAANVGAEVVEDALLAQQRGAAGTAPTSESASGRSRSGRCRSAAPAARTPRPAARSRAASGPCRSSDQSASGCRCPRLKTTSRASTPFRRSACTFSHGIPAMLTGQCVTRRRACFGPCGSFVTVPSPSSAIHPHAARTVASLQQSRAKPSVERSSHS